MFENGNPDNVLKTIKAFIVKRIPIIIFISENSFKFVVLVMQNKMLVIVFIFDFLIQIWAGIKKPQSFNFYTFLTLQPKILILGTRNPITEIFLACFKELRLSDSSLPVCSVSCTVHLQLFTIIDILQVRSESTYNN